MPSFQHILACALYLAGPHSHQYENLRVLLDNSPPVCRSPAEALPVCPGGPITVSGVASSVLYGWTPYFVLTLSCYIQKLPLVLFFFFKKKETSTK